MYISAFSLHPFTYTYIYIYIYSMVSKRENGCCICKKKDPVMRLVAFQSPASRHQPRQNPLGQQHLPSAIQGRPFQSILPCRKMLFTDLLCRCACAFVSVHRETTLRNISTDIYIYIESTRIYNIHLKARTRSTKKPSTKPRGRPGINKGKQRGTKTKDTVT